MQKSQFADIFLHFFRASFSAKWVVASVGYLYPNVGFLKKILGFEQGFEVF